MNILYNLFQNTQFINVWIGMGKVRLITLYVEINGNIWYLISPLKFQNIFFCLFSVHNTMNLLCANKKYLRGYISRDASSITKKYSPNDARSISWNVALLSIFVLGLTNSLLKPLSITTVQCFWPKPLAFDFVAVTVLISRFLTLACQANKYIPLVKNTHKV